MDRLGLDAFHPLLPAEEEVVATLQSGDFDRLGEGTRPDEYDPARAVRAEFLRYLLLGAEETIRLHEKGIRVQGAWIVGVLDLEGCRIPRDLGLKKCGLDSAPVLRSAIIDNLFLDGSVFPGLDADRLEARGTVSMRGTEINGPVSFLGARLGGNLDCNGATIKAPGAIAVQGEDLDARGVLLRGAEIVGGINLAGARLTADVEATGLSVENGEADAIDARAVETRGSFVLRGAKVTGNVSLVGARIGGDLNARDAQLSNPGSNALQINRAVISGAFALLGKARVDGVLDMTGANIGTIHDAAECWPAKGDLLLNRCLYEAFIDGPVEAEVRLDWLSRQTPKRWGEDFWPQPFEQLATVFRQMGHDEDSRTVLIAKERLQRRARRERASNPLWRGLLALTDGILAVTVLYGRQPLLAFVWLIVFWAIGIVVFQRAESNGAFKPNSAVALRSVEWTMCGLPPTEKRFLISIRQELAGLAAPGQTQLDCFRSQPEASSYPVFNASMYSLETLIPILEIDQKSFWRPEPAQPGGRLAVIYFYFQSVVGWALSLLAVAGFSGLVKSR